MPYLIAIALATITSLVGYNLPFYKSQDFYGILLVMLAGGYLGLAVSDGRRYVLMLELGVALGFCLLVLVGNWRWPVLIAYGYFLHAAWNLLHQPFRVGARVKSWYALIGVIYESLVGAFMYMHMFR